MTLYQKARVRWDETGRIPEGAQGKFCWTLARSPIQPWIILDPNTDDLIITEEASYHVASFLCKGQGFAIPQEDLELQGGEEAFCYDPPPETYEQWLERPRTAEELRK